MGGAIRTNRIGIRRGAVCSNASLIRGGPRCPNLLAGPSHPPPPILPSNVWIGPADPHVDSAPRRDQFSAPPESAIVWRANVIGSKCVNFPEGVIARRASAAQAQVGAPPKLDPMRERRAQRFPPDSPAYAINLPLIAFVARAFDYADMSFSGGDFVRHAHRWALSCAKCPYVEGKGRAFLDGCLALGRSGRNLLNVGRARRKIGTEEAAAFWEMALTEIEKRTPTPISPEAMWPPRPPRGLQSARSAPMGSRADP